MWELIGEGKNPSHLFPRADPLMKVAQTVPLNHQQLHLGNQSLLGLEPKMNGISHSSAMLACVTQISG